MLALGSDPQSYWRGLVRGGSSRDVDEVGHYDMGRSFNLLAYDLRLRALQRSLEAARWQPRAARVFEAAYGVGFYLDFWRSQACRHVAGVELSETAFENVRPRFAGYDLRRDDLALIDAWSDWQRLQGSFSVVTAIDVLYHVMEEERARGALRNLGRLVETGGVLIVTDKSVGLAKTAVEGRYVVRRPFSWYQESLAPLGFELERQLPIFWCMDPPVSYGPHALSARLGYLCWGGMRAALKFWPRNSRGQLALGRAVGSLGRCVDLALVPRLRQAPNLTMATFRKRAR